MRLWPLALLAVAACKPSGPSEADLARRKELCARPALRERWQQLVALGARVKDAPPVKDEPLAPGRPIKLRELHTGEGATDAYFLSDFEGAPARGIIGGCVARQETCRPEDPTLEDALKACESIDSVVIVRTLREEKATFGEQRAKYTGGRLEGEAFVFVLGADAGQQVAAFPFAAKLSGEVEVWRDSTNAEIEKALGEGMRRSALRQVEAMLVR